MMKRYTKYKDSGIAWLGEIPEDWEVKKIRYLTSYFKGLGFKSSEFSDSGIPIVKASDIKNGNIESISSYIDIDNQKEEFEKVRLSKGDIVISTVGSKPNIVNSAVGQIANIEDNFDKAYLNQNIVCIRTIGRLDNNYLKYVFKSKYIRSSFDFHALWIANQAYLQIDSIRSINIIFPPLEEQKAIAAYLDHKTAEIDQLIAQKERLIKLYEEEKTAIINKAVTKGINSDVKLKPSGIDWLGDIPEHWNLKRLRYLGTCQNGVSKSAEYFGSGYPFVNYTDVYNNIELPQEVQGLANSTDEDQISYSVKQGDIFFTRTSETIEEIGMASTCLKTIEKAIFSGFLIRFRPFNDLLFIGFSKYYFRSRVRELFFVKEMNLVTRASLSQELLKKLPVLLPPLEEQKEIVNYIEKECARIDSKIAKTKRIIELQKEYRTALISEAVTGKIKVPELVS